MKKKNKIIIGIIGIIIAVFAVINGIIIIHDATTVTIDDLKQEEALFDEAVENGTINNTTEKDKLNAKEEAIHNTFDNTDERIKNAIKT